MISLELTITSAAVSALVVGVAAWRMLWDTRAIATASLGTASTILLWRLVSNAGDWNGDFMPLVSIDDTGCVLAGALAPTVVTRRLPTGTGRWIPAMAGAGAAFVVNVVIL